MEKPSVENVDISAEKLSAIDPDDFKVDEDFDYRILNFLAVFSAIS